MVVLLPGMDGTGDLFAPLVDAMPAGAARVVAWPREALGYDALVDLAGDVDGAVLVGESFSGPIAIRLAAERDVAGLVLVASFSTSPVRLPGFLAGVVRLAQPPRVAIRALLAGWDAPEALVDQVARTIASVPGSVMAHRLRSIAAVDVRETWSRVRAPALYLAGRRDALVGRRSRDELAAIRPVDTVELDAPHLVLQRRPREAWDAIARWRAEGRGPLSGAGSRGP